MKNASFIEVFWTLIAVSGFVVQAAILRDAWRDRRAVLDRGNRRRGMLVRGHLRTGGIFLVVHTLFVFAGVSAMLNPDPPRGAPVSRWLVIGGLISAAVLLVAAGVLDRRDRIRLREPSEQA